MFALSIQRQESPQTPPNMYIHNYIYIYTCIYHNIRKYWNILWLNVFFHKKTWRTVGSIQFLLICFFVAGSDRFFSIAEARLKAAGCNPEVFDLVPGMKQTRRDGRIAWRKSNIFPNMFALSLQWYFPEGIHRVCLCCFFLSFA